MDSRLPKESVGIVQAEVICHIPAIIMTPEHYVTQC